MTLQDILALLEQNQGQGGSQSAASVSPAALTGSISPASGIASTLGGDLGGFLGGNPNSEAGNLGGMAGSLGGLALTPFLGPLGPLAGAFGGELIGSLFGNSVPREAKTASIGQALTNTGDPLAELLGKYVTTGVGGGHVFSESGPKSFGGATDQVAAMLEALTGQQIPGVTGTGADFSKNPTYSPGALGKVGTNLQLPQGFEFVNDPSKYPQIMKDIEALVPMGGSLAGAPGIKQEEGRWKELLSQLQSQGILQRYQGGLGAPGANGGTPGQGQTGIGGPGIALPHPLANQQNSKFPPSPYPLTAGA